jgi:hypothetical protein
MEWLALLDNITSAAAQLTIRARLVDVFELGYSALRPSRFSSSRALLVLNPNSHARLKASRLPLRVEA